MKCSYPNRLKATVCPRPFAFGARRLAGLALVLVVACGAHWTGSVGAVLGKNVHDGRLYVRDAPPDMGAAKAGVQVGDELVSIEGKPCRAMSPAEVHEALAGSVGSKVKLTVMRDGQALDFVIQRGPLRGD